MAQTPVACSLWPRPAGQGSQGLHFAADGVVDAPGEVALPEKLGGSVGSVQAAQPVGVVGQAGDEDDVEDVDGPDAAHQA